MPLDPAILLSLRPPAPIATPDEVAIKQLTADEARLKMRQNIETAQDNAALQNAIRINLGPDGLPDYHKALTQLYSTRPNAAAKLQSAMTSARKAQAETDDLEDKHKGAVIDSVGQIVQGSTPENWPVRYSVLQRNAPEVASMFGPQWTPDMQDKIDTFTSAATKRKDYIDQQEKAREHFLKGDDQKAIASRINALGDNATPDAVMDILRDARDKWGASPQDVSQVASLPDMPSVKAWARKAELGQKEVETLQQTADRNAQLAKTEDMTRQQTAIRDAATVANEAANRALRAQEIGIQQHRENRETAQQAQQGAPVAPLDPKDPGFKVAQDLAYGRLPFAAFRTLEAYNRNAARKEQIYATAGQLNPNFNPAAFEMGFTLAKNPKVQQQLASLDNVERGVPDLLKFSDAAARSGATILNKAILPGGVALGGRTYSNFRTARTAFADELSGALGYGSATDMSREMGFDMTNENLSPENFRAAVQDVVIPFVQRKRQTLLNQMGVYGQSGMNPAASSGVPAAPASGSMKVGKYTVTPIK